MENCHFTNDTKRLGRVWLHILYYCIHTLTTGHSWLNTKVTAESRSSNTLATLKGTVKLSCFIG